VLEDAGVEVIRRYDETVGVIEGDRGNLRVALGNLVQNAVEAMEPGGQLVVEIVSEGGWVRLEFADTGRGIPKSAIPSVFDPFYTSKMAGAGMGLTMVHRIVTRHGGEVDITSEEGRGTRVILRLPVAQKKSI
jgi:signal transduction histidine kinase